MFWKARGITQYDSFEKYDALPPKRHKPHLGSFVSVYEEKDKNRKPKLHLQRVRVVFWKARGITQYDSFEKYDALPPKRHKPHLGSFVSLDEEKDKNRKPKRSLPLINPCWQED